TRLVGFAFCLLLAVWAAAAPAPFRRGQEATAALAVETDERAEQVLSQLRAFQAREASAGCRLTFEECDGGRRTVHVRLQTDGADAQELLASLVERCLCAVFPTRQGDADLLRKLRGYRNDPDVAEPDTRGARMVREMLDFMIDAL